MMNVISEQKMRTECTYDERRTKVLGADKEKVHGD